MANFSGVLSTNDTESSKICGGLVAVVLEYEVIRDLVYNTYKYKANIYLDATQCKYLSTVEKDNSLESSIVFIKRAIPGEFETNGNPKYEHINQGASEGNWYSADYSFFVPKFSMLSFDTSKRALLKTVESNTIQVGEASETIMFDVTIRPGDVWRAYEKNILSYVESNSRGVESLTRTITFRGISPNTIKSIDGDSFLGQPQTIQVNKTEPEFTHTIECVGWRGEGEDREEIVVPVCTKSASESVSFVPPESLSELNSHGKEVNVTFRMTTYYGDTKKGEHTFDFVFNTPENVAPSCTVEVTDGEGLSDVYGGFLQNHSRFHIRVIPTFAYGSPIQAFEVDVDGLVYTLAKPEMDTALIKHSGAHSIKARVLDYRGHWSDYCAVTVEVLTYNGPVISEITAVRSDINGTENEKGDYFKVIFSSAVTPIDGKNTATYVVMHSKATGLDYIERVLDDYTGQYSVNNGVYIFPADKDSTYVVQLKVIDSFEEHSRTTGGGLVVILQSWLASGRGMCFGGIATLEDTVECQFKFYPSGGLIIPPYPYEDLFVKDPNVYYVEKPANVSGSPTEDPYILEIYPTNPDGTDVVQRATTCPKKGGVPKVLVRACRESNWGDFCDMTTGQAI